MGLVITGFRVISVSKPTGFREICMFASTSLEEAAYAVHEVVFPY
jgi:hypothetical protein